jgi:hypothetical protein
MRWAQPRPQPMRRLYPLMLVALTMMLVATARVAAQPAITVAPSQVDAGTSVTLTVTSSGGLDLSGVGPSQVAILPSDGVSNLQAIPQPSSPSTLLRVDFSLDAGAPLGSHTVIVVGPNNVTAAATFTVQPFPAPECPAGQSCCRRNSTTLACTTCSAQCPRPVCAGGNHCCAADPLDSSRCLHQCIPNTQACPPPPK